MHCLVKSKEGIPGARVVDRVVHFSLSEVLKKIEIFEYIHSTFECNGTSQFKIINSSINLFCNFVDEFAYEYSLMNSSVDK